MRKITIIMGASILLLIILLSAFSSIDTTPVERTIIGKGADGNGNTWLIVAECISCERENVQVERLDDYKIGDRFP